MIRPIGDPMLPEDPKATRRVLGLEKRTHFLYASYTMADMMIVKRTLEEMIENRTIAVFIP